MTESGNIVIDGRDTRGESKELACCFAILVSCCHQVQVLSNAQGIFALILKYLKLYTVENQAF